MKKPKAIKRALSLVLAIMLLAGMLPMGAFAAEAENVVPIELTVDADSSDWVDFQIMAAKNLYDGEGKLSDGGSTPDADHTDRTGVQLMRGYVNDGIGGTFATNAKYDFSTAGSLMTNADDELEKSDANTAVLEKVAGLSNKLFQDETNLGQNVLRVKPGDTFYLGFNLAGHYNGNNIKGIVGFASAIAMDVETFKVNFANKAGADIGYVANNMLTSSGLNSGNFSYSILSTVPDYTAYAGVTSLISSGANNTFNGTANSGFSFVYRQTEDNYIPEKTTWDFLVKVTVDENAEAKTYTIGSSPDVNTPNRVLWSNVTPASDLTRGTIFNTEAAAGASTGNLKSNTIQIEVYHASDPPVVDPEQYEASIRDVKNLPYVTANTEDADAMAALNDTITIPSPTDGTSGFKTGDVLFLYADKEHTQELGHTVLNEETVVHKDEGTGAITAATDADKTALTDGADLAGKTFRLAYSTINNTDPESVTFAIAENGYSYLKGESVVYLARLAKEHIGDNTYQPSDEEIKIEVASEDTPIYYHGDINVRGTKAGCDAAHPLDVKFGTTVQDLLSQLGDDILGTVDAPVEDGEKDPAAEIANAKTVETSLDTSKATLTSKYADILSTDEDTNEAYISKHGKVELVFPYKDASDTNHTYTQPTAHVDGTAPVYGAKIYLNVTPDPADYYFAAVSEDKTMTVSGKTWKHFSRTDSPDKIAVYKDNEGAKGSGIITVGFSAFSGSDTINSGLSTLPVAGQYVWVAYKEGGDSGVESTAVRVLVTDGTPQIADDIVFKKGGGDDGTVYIFENSVKLKEILEDENVLPVEIPLNGSEEKGAAFKQDAAVIAAAEGITYEKLNAETKLYENSDADAFNGRQVNDQFRISIPITDAVLTAITKNTTAGLPAGYKNNGNRKFQITVNTVTRVTMNAAEGGYQTAVVENNYLGKDDIFTIGNVEKNALNAKVGDTVRVYKTYNAGTCSDQIGIGTVTKVDGGESGPMTFTCKVDQLGRNKEDVVYVRFMGDGDTCLNMTGAIEMTLNKDEDYAFFSLSTYADPLKVTPEAATPGVDDIYGAVSAPTIKYGYYVKDGEGVISEDATATYSQTLENTESATQYAWTDNGAENTTYFDGTNPSTLTLSNTAELKSKAADGTGVNEEVPIVIQADKTRTTVAHIKYVAKEVDPLTDEIANAIHDNLTIANNPYPQGDAITVAKAAGASANGVTVKFYSTEADATNAQNEVFSFKLGEISTNDIVTNITKEGNTAAQNRAILGTGAGTLYVTYESDDTKVNTTSRTVDYTAEPFIVRGSTIDPTSLSVNTKVLAPEEVAAVEGETPVEENELTRLIAKLPKQMTATADRLEGETPYTAISGETKNVPMTITGWEKEDGSTLTVEDVQKAITDAKASTAETKAVNLKLKAVYTEESLPASIAVDGANVSLLTAITDGTNPVAKTEGFNKAAFTVTVTANDEIAPSQEMTLPEDIANWVKPLVGDPGNNETKYTENDGNPANDAIDFTMTDDSVADAKGATVKVSYTAPGPKAATATGVIDATTGLLYITAPDKFEGFDTTNPSLQVQFTKDGYADSDYFTIDVAGVATALTIDEVENPRTLNIPLGMTKDEVLGLINGVGNVNVKFDSASTPNGSMPLVQESGKVTWTLKKGTATGNTETGDATGLTDVSGDWTTELNDAATPLYLTAPVNTADGYGDGTNNVAVNDTNLLAIIPVTLYNDKTNPLQLEAGNNDLYYHGTDAGTPANNRLKTLAGDADLNEYKENFKNSLVFWYRYETETDVKGWETEAKITSINGAEIGEGKTYADFNAWKTAAAEGTRSFSYKECNADGTAINKAVTINDGSTVNLTSINPQHVEKKGDASDAKDYFAFNEAGKIYRDIEEYKIVYTVTDGKDIYVAQRTVKLTYRCGDADLDGVIGAQDAGAANQYFSEIKAPFVDANGSRNTRLSMEILNLDEDETAGAQDAGLMNQIFTGIKTYPDHRY